MKTLLTASVLALVATSAAAQTKYATITNVQPNYQTVYMNVPQQQCQNIQVPVYGTVKNGQASTGDTILGAVIGGAIGNQFGNGSGRDAATVLGAIIGADVANKKPRDSQQIIGYREERQCSEVVVREQQREIKNYTITYRWNGVTTQSYTYNNYRVGDRLPVNVSIQAD